MLNGRARDIKKHKWFEGVDWEALAARRIEPNRLPQEDSAKRIKELAVRPLSHYPCNQLIMMQCIRQPPPDCAVRVWSREWQALVENSVKNA